MGLHIKELKAYLRADDVASDKFDEVRLLRKHGVTSVGDLERGNEVQRRDAAILRSTTREQVNSTRIFRGIDIPTAFRVLRKGLPKD